MNFNPTNEQGLLSLVAALKGGMDPSTAYSMYQGIASDQATELARRQERLTSLSDLMMDAAGGGATYEQASMLAEAQPGPAGPAVQSMLDTYYPYADAELGDRQATVATLNQSPGSQMSGAAPYGEQSVSPVYNGPDPMAQMQQQTAALELQQAQYQAALPTIWQSLIAEAQSWKEAKGMTMEGFMEIMKTSPEYQMLLGNYPDDVVKALQGVWYADLQAAQGA